MIIYVIYTAEDEYINNLKLNILSNIKIYFKLLLFLL